MMHADSGLRVGRWIAAAIVIVTVGALLAVLASAIGGTEDEAALTSIGQETQASLGPTPAAAVGAATNPTAARPPASTPPTGRSAPSSPEIVLEDRLDLPSADDGAQAPVIPDDVTQVQFRVPIDGASVSAFAGHWPSSPREYRNGTHEGLDFYSFGNSVSIDFNTPILAAAGGTIIRIDRSYEDLTVGQWDQLVASNFAELDTLDVLRGRQVWIDHGNGAITRYAHLGAVTAGLELGSPVRAGAVVGFAGESGTPESIFAPGTDAHLHFEIWQDGRFLGQGLGPEVGAQLYRKAFGLDDLVIE